MSLIDDHLASMQPPRPAAVRPCRVCGWTPAGAARFLSVVGFFPRARLIRREALFCRTCGIATFRQMTSGAIGRLGNPVAWVVVPIIVALNLLQRRRVARLAPPRAPAKPVTAAARAMNPDLPPRDAPMPLGKPVWRRARMLVILVPLTVLGFVVGIGIATGVDTPAPLKYSIGDCLHWNGRQLTKTACGSVGELRVIDIVPAIADCPADTTVRIGLSGSTKSDDYCLGQ